MHIKVLDTCLGCGACAIVNNLVFEMNGDKPTVVEHNIQKTEDLCIDAAISCPVGAIILEEY